MEKKEKHAKINSPKPAMVVWWYVDGVWGCTGVGGV
jgi:hypothetical protein